MRHLIEGSYPAELKVRRCDFMSEEVALLNELTQSLRDREDLIRQQAVVLGVQAEECRRSVAQRPDDLELMMSEFATRVSRYVESFSDLVEIND
jgi:hypothetical protein